MCCSQGGRPGRAGLSAQLICRLSCDLNGPRVHWVLAPVSLCGIGSGFLQREENNKLRKLPM